MPTLYDKIAYFYEGMYIVAYEGACPQKGQTRWLAQKGEHLVVCETREAAKQISTVVVRHKWSHGRRRFTTSAMALTAIHAYGRRLAALRKKKEEAK